MDSKKNEQKPTAAVSKPVTDVNFELDKLAAVVSTEINALSESSGLSLPDLCSQLVARIRYSSRRVAAAPVRHSSGAQFQPPPR